MITVIYRYFLVAAIFFGCLRASQAVEPLPVPKGPVILTVQGNITRTNAPGRAEFDRSMLEELGWSTLRTTSSFTEGVQTFEGVPAARVIEAVGAKGATVLAIAANDYKADIPLSDFMDYPVLFALKNNGKDLTLRDKGPIWIVYPQDDYRIFRKEIIDLRWVWQLRELQVQ